MNTPVISTSLFPELTAREREVLAHILAGESARCIGFALHLSKRTVECHKGNIFEKLACDGPVPVVHEFYSRGGIIDAMSVPKAD